MICPLKWKTVESCKKDSVEVEIQICRSCNVLLNLTKLAVGSTLIIHTIRENTRVGELYKLNIFIYCIVFLIRLRNVLLFPMQSQKEP